MSNYKLSDAWFTPLAVLDEQGNVIIADLDEDLDERYENEQGILIPVVSSDGHVLSERRQKAILKHFLTGFSRTHFDMLIGVLRRDPEETRTQVLRWCELFKRITGINDNLAAMRALGVKGFAVCAPRNESDAEAQRKTFKFVLDLGLPTVIYDAPELSGAQIDASAIEGLEENYDNLALIMREEPAPETIEEAPASAIDTDIVEEPASISVEEKIEDAVLVLDEEVETVRTIDTESEPETIETTAEVETSEAEEVTEELPEQIVEDDSVIISEEVTDVEESIEETVVESIESAEEEIPAEVNAETTAYVEIDAAVAPVPVTGAAAERGIVAVEGATTEAKDEIETEEANSEKTVDEEGTAVAAETVDAKALAKQKKQEEKEKKQQEKQQEKERKQQEKEQKKLERAERRKDPKHKRKVTAAILAAEIAAACLLVVGISNLHNNQEAEVRSEAIAEASAVKFVSTELTPIISEGSEAVNGEAEAAIVQAAIDKIRDAAENLEYVPEERSSDIESSETYKLVQGAYTWTGGRLTKNKGTNTGPNGRETYYNLNMSGIVKTMRRMGNTDTYWVRSDGCKMLGNYIMVAANLGVHPRGSIVKCSLGLAIVCDTGGFASKNPQALDIATSW